MSDELEIEALTDEDLEEVAGGQHNCTSNSCSEKDCSGGGDDKMEMGVSVSAL